MRKHSVRKWLHAILDLLPLILIPVFMVYSHRHDMTERTQVDIQYKYETNEPSTFNDLIVGNVYHLDELHLYPYDDYNFSLVIYTYECNDYSSNELADLDLYLYNVKDYVLNFIIDSNACSVYYIDINTGNYVCIISFEDYDISFSNVDFSIVHGLSDFDVFAQDTNLALPSSSDFNVIESVTVEDTSSDIMSVVMNDLNNVTDKYFNMDKTFNLGAIHDWVNTNLFLNEPPLVANIVWHIISYEFIMDLVFLVYAVFMFVIDFADRCLNSFFDKSFGGGR